MQWQEVVHVFYFFEKTIVIWSITVKCFFTARQHVVKNVIEVRNIVLEREFDFIQH